MLREARLGAGVSQTELGQRLDMSQLQISRGEVGDRSIEVLELRDMCHALGISFADFTRQLDETLSHPYRSPQKTPSLTPRTYDGDQIVCGFNANCDLSRINQQLKRKSYMRSHR